ncbi:hypothetical protein SHI21_16760 [Bacteriovorax sp. PP10]|uniref:Uncharacterized protein n=1 Tax=Bacteriovorax antarcticus TaxID=3088717 RepID=A0ABU5W002_9BACT|nr:hypothetical protein [Bacteriovorax sp. PP10]MEA9357884.1 hypothetical protein [Bacteriovorax sp. PP10]
MKKILTFITLFISFNSFAIVITNQPICERPSRKALLEFDVTLNKLSHELFQNKMESFFNKICWEDIEPKMLVDQIYKECSDFAAGTDSLKLNTVAEFQIRCESLKQHALTLLRASEVAKKNKCEQKKETPLDGLDNFLQKSRNAETLEKY